MLKPEAKIPEREVPGKSGQHGVTEDQEKVNYL